MRLDYDWANAMQVKKNPPSRVTLSYRVVGDAAKTHVFTSDDVPGLHIGSSSRKTAFHEAIAGLGELVSHRCGYEVVYRSSLTYEEFVRRLEDRHAAPADSLLSKFVVVTREECVPA